jgi:hypothetical protein
MRPAALAHTRQASAATAAAGSRMTVIRCVLVQLLQSQQAVPPRSTCLRRCCRNPPVTRASAAAAPAATKYAVKDDAKALFSPVTLGALQLSHRVVMAPLTRCRCESRAVVRWRWRLLAAARSTHAMPGLPPA